jgi:hypothetical protein
VAEDEVVLVVSEASGGRGGETASFLYRGQVPEEGQEIDRWLTGGTAS